MRYKLALDQPLPDQLRRIAGKQAKRLHRPADPAHPDVAAVHTARKAGKRLRALLHLVRTPETIDDARRLDRQIRDYGRRLSNTRDLTVLQTVAARAATEFAWPPRLAAAIGRRLEAMPAPPHAVHTAAIVRDADDIAAALDAFPWDRIDDATVWDGIRKTYKAGRRERHAAVAADTSEAYHDWRKLVQRHFRHLKLIEDAWPEALAVQFEAARTLSHLLGAEHDLDMLARWLAEPGHPGTIRTAAPRLHTALAERQATLRRDAVRLGARLYAEAPRAVVDRLRAYAETPGPMPALSAVVPNGNAETDTVSGGLVVDEVSV